MRHAIDSNNIHIITVLHTFDGYYDFDNSIQRREKSPICTDDVDEYSASLDGNHIVVIHSTHHQYTLIIRRRRIFDAVRFLIIECTT